MSDCEHDVCAPIDGGKFGKTRCTACGMVFRMCVGCSESNTAERGIYHAEPMCRTEAERLLARAKDDPEAFRRETASAMEAARYFKRAWN